MFATLLTLALFAAPALNAVAAFDISTPDLVQVARFVFMQPHSSRLAVWFCPYNLGQDYCPYNLIVVDSADPCGDVLQRGPSDHTSTSITWKVDFPANKTLMFSLEDADGNEAWSSAMKVGASTDASCLNNAAAAASSASSGVAASASKSTIAPTATVAAAGAAVTSGSSSDGSDTSAGPLALPVDPAQSRLST
ncbi:hypothetical protein B0H10DRAFT_2226096 [Mycena sp. CBHHK59/15]|nr:hypothetical protein B0H10DRAFT_2226096 [Mycena sp. CBHHK59/15]